MSHDDFDFEPTRGLPAALPPGEELLWQGTPDWGALAIRAYQVRKVGVYFLLLVGWRIAVGVHAGHSASAIAGSCAFLLGLGLLAMGVLALLAYTGARSTVYSITSRRVLMRFGVAVPLTMNLPLKFIDSAALRRFAGGTGDVSLKLPKRDRIGYLITWPHLRPGHFAQPQPSLRALKDAAEAAQILSAALRSQADQPSAALRPAASASGAGLLPLNAGSTDPRSAAAA